MTEKPENIDDYIKIKANIIRHDRKKNEVYITKDIPLSPTLLKIKQILKSHETVKLYSVGAANYKALKIALIIKKNVQNLTSEISSSTYSTTDFYIPKFSNLEKREVKRNMNSLIIILSKYSPL